MKSARHKDTRRALMHPCRAIRLAIKTRVANSDLHGPPRARPRLPTRPGTRPIVSRLRHRDDQRFHVRIREHPPERRLQRRRRAARFVPDGMSFNARPSGSSSHTAGRRFFAFSMMRGKSGLSPPHEIKRLQEALVKARVRQSYARHRSREVPTVDRVVEHCANSPHAPTSE